MPVSPSLEKEEVLLGRKDMIAWNILGEDIKQISDKETTRQVGRKEVNSCYNKDEEGSDTSAPSATGKSKATGLSVALHSSTQVSGSADVSVSSKGLEDIERRFIKKNSYIFTDESGSSYHVDCEHVRLTVGDMEVKPFHFPDVTDIPANHEVEVKKMIQSMLKAGIIQDVAHPTPW